MLKTCKPFDIGAAFDAGWNARGKVHEDFMARVLAKADDLESRLAAVEGEIREGAK